MNHKILLSLIAIPTLASSMLVGILFSGRVLAAKTLDTTASCDAPAIPQHQSSRLHSTHQGILIASADPEFDFTDAESDAAVTLFGCDCSNCISALRQLRNPNLLDASQGHCWSSMRLRTSPEEVKEVLENLEAK